MTLATASEPQRRPPEVEAGIRRAEVELERPRWSLREGGASCCQRGGGPESSERPVSPWQRWCDVRPRWSRRTEGARQGRMPDGHCRHQGWKERRCRRATRLLQELHTHVDRVEDHQGGGDRAEDQQGRAESRRPPGWNRQSRRLPGWSRKDDGPRWSKRSEETS